MPRLRRNRAPPTPDEDYSESSSSSEESASSEESSSSEESASDDSSDDGGEERGDYDDGEYDEDDDDEEGSYDPMSDALDALIDSVVDYEDPDECWELVREWLRIHSADETREAVEFKGEFDTTALHVACRNSPPVDVVDVMLMAAPDMIYWADSFGWLPVSLS